MQAIREEDRIKAVVLVAATVGIFGFIGYQIYGATKPATSTTVSANRTISQGEAQTAGGVTPTPVVPAPNANANVSVSGVAPNRINPFRDVLARPGTAPAIAQPVPTGPRPSQLPGANPNGSQVTTGPTPTLPPTGPNIPSIAPVFKGSILGNRRAVVLSINGRDVIINEGEVRDGVRVVRVEKESATIRLAGSKETIILKAAP